MLFTVQQPIDLAIYVHRASLSLVKSFKDIYIKLSICLIHISKFDQIFVAI